MTFRGTLRRCFVWLLCLSLCLGLAVPALAADNTGTEIRLLQTEGTVNVSSTSGKTYSTREDMRLYSGYVVSTEEASYAWITLDAEKAVKLDECSSLEVRRSGKSLELLLKSGEMYCDVTAPLKEDEKLNIRTSTMVTGVRGTIVFIQKINDGETRMGVLEGHAQGVAINPITGATRALMVQQGQIGVFQIFDADQAGEGADAWLLGMKADDVPPFVQVQIAQDRAAQERVPKELQKTLAEALEDLLNNQARIRQKLKEIEELKEKEVISKDRLWEGEQDGGGNSASYTITWNIDGRTETTTCKAGVTPSHGAPAKEGYIFVGWSPALAPAEADAAYTAVYVPIDTYVPEPGPQKEQYTITWIIDGVSYTSRYSEGVLPSRTAPAKDGYEFVGWDPEIQKVTGDATYTAVFEEIQTVYTITWQLEEGVVLETSEVSPGERPNYPGEEQPTKEGYRFVGWDPTVVEATEDAVYTAVFEEIDPQAETGTITWIINGEEETEEYTLGDTPTHEIPSMDSFVFTGWYDGSRVYGPQEELPAVTGDTTYTAEFEEIPQDYTVTWVIDGESEEATYGYGDTPSHDTPEKESTEAKVYRFLGWSDGTETYAPEELPEVTGDVTYTAEFEESPRDYTVTWVIDGESEDSTWGYGDTPSHDVPEKESTEDTVYRFLGWSDGTETYPAEELPEVTGDVTYTAEFEESPRDYTVTWVIDGESEDSTWGYGETPSHDVPEKESTEDTVYRFLGWSDETDTYAPEELPEVTGDVTYTAEFEESPRDYTVTWVIDGESEDSTWGYGDTPSHDVPEKESTEDTVYRFLGWSDGTETYAPEELPEVTGDVTYTAEFEESPRDYTVTWVIDGESEDSTWGYGDTPSHEIPEKEPTEDTEYRFLGWSDETDTYAPEELPEVTGDVTYTAEFEESPRDYTVTWVIDGESEDSTWGYGDTPSHEIPEKEPTEDTEYRFLGWSDETDTYAPEELPEVTGDVTYTAEFEESPRDYTVTWVIDGESEDSTWGYGDTPSHEEPEKEADGEIEYRFLGWNDGTNTYSEELPEVTGDVTYTAKFEEVYPIYIPERVDGGTVEADKGAAAETEPVTVTVVPDEGYEIEAVLALYEIDGEGTELSLDGTDGVYSFEMPAAAVTLEVRLKRLYAVTVEDPENSPTLVADVEMAAEGDTVTVTVTADGYTIDSVIAEYDDGEIEATGENGVYTFEMPAADVTVRASLTAQEFTAWARSPEDAPDGSDVQVYVLYDENQENYSTSLPFSTDETVTVLVYWNSLYCMVDSVTMTWDGGSETQNMAIYSPDGDTYGSTFTFTMPAGDADFRPNVSPVYDIEIYEMMLSNATVSVNGSEPGSEMLFHSKAGEEVSVVITPTDGSAIAAGSKPSVTYTVDNTITAVDVSGDNGSYRFIMPEYPVSVNMNYVSVDPSDQATITISANGTEVTVTGYEALYVSAGTTVNVHAVVPEGEGVLVWNDLDSVNPEDLEYEATVSENQKEATYTFTMPENQIVEITLAIHGA